MVVGATAYVASVRGESGRSACTSYCYFHNKYGEYVLFIVVKYVKYVNSFWDFV